jgi:hypothetical protein
MKATIWKFVRRGCVVSLWLAAAAVLLAQQKTFDGDWQMDAAKSHVLDGRTMDIVIATVGDGIKVVIKAKKGDGPATTSEFISKLNGKACEFDEGSHKSQLTMWFDGTTLNASKENGPPGDVTSMWKFELAPDKQTLTLTINHYDPAAEDEKIVFTKKAA